MTPSTVTLAMRKPTFGVIVIVSVPLDATDVAPEGDTEPFGPAEALMVHPGKQVPESQ